MIPAGFPTPAPHSQEITAERVLEVLKRTRQTVHEFSVRDAEEVLAKEELVEPPAPAEGMTAEKVMAALRSAGEAAKRMHEAVKSKDGTGSFRVAKRA